jgi:DNA mismatch endonuclease (patch repair protein)
MARVRSRDTTPEIQVRSLLHRLGYRFRLHRKELPGTPDLVFPSRRKVIFIHGCFWHQHPGCRKATAPKTRAEFWRSKLNKNVQRDAIAQERLQAEGWGTLVIWECEIAASDLAARLCGFLGPTRPRWRGSAEHDAV